MASKLLIYTLVKTDILRTALAQALPSKSYDVKILTDDTTFVNEVSQEQQDIDCLIVDGTADVAAIFSTIATDIAFLPAVVIQSDAVGSSTSHQPAEGQADIPTSTSETTTSQANPDDLQSSIGELYHTAVLWLGIDQLEKLQSFIDHSIVQFLKLSPEESQLPEKTILERSLSQQGQKILMLQQKRLSQKLKERLGYLGVYYKRNPANFLRHMEPADKQAFLAQLKQDYREIILGYFTANDTINQKIDNYIHVVFFADVPVAQVVEIHMELMDEFSKHLKLEGRSEEILLDYRLTLIDTLANLCEIYRRSIPQEP